MRMNKKGISVIVGYVLLVSMTLGLSVMVFNWLKFYVSEGEVAECPDNVNIVIKDYECHQSVFSLGTDPDKIGNITITLKNKGLFSTDGYILKFHDREEAEFGIYSLNDTGKALAPGEEQKDVYYFDEIVGHEPTTITLIEVQPFLKNEGSGPHHSGQTAFPHKG